MFSHILSVILCQCVHRSVSGYNNYHSFIFLSNFLVIYMFLVLWGGISVLVVGWNIYDRFLWGLSWLMVLLYLYAGEFLFIEYRVECSTIMWCRLFLWLLVRSFIGRFFGIGVVVVLFGWV